MKPLPLPVRLAAGLAVTAVDRARHLPAKLTELPVTMVSQALQLSMRLQQQVTELAIKGDDALATLRPVEESPAWATFDEDATGEQYDISPNGPATNNGARSRFDTIGEAEADAEAQADTDSEADVEAEADETEDERAAAQDPWAAEERAMLDELDGTPEADVEETLAPQGKSPSDRREPGEATPTASTEPAETAPAGGTTAAQPTEAAEPADNRPGGVPNYPDLTLPQLRARLRRLDTGQLAELLAYETAHADRPEFVGMLTRRIATLRDQQ